MKDYFHKPKSLGANVKVDLCLFNYATKADLKKATSVDISEFAKKTDLANLKSDPDKLDFGKLKNVPSNLSNLKSKIDKLVPVPVDLNKLTDLVDVVVVDVENDVVKKGV